MGEQPVDDVDVVGAVVGHFRYGAVADIGIARKACGAGEMRLGNPHSVVADEVRERVVEKRAAFFGVGSKLSAIKR